MPSQLHTILSNIRGIFNHWSLFFIVLFKRLVGAKGDRKMETGKGSGQIRKGEGGEGKGERVPAASM